MKKILGLLFVCLLLTSCGKKQEENQQNNQPQQNQSEHQENFTLVKTLDDGDKIFISNEDITYNNENLSEALSKNTIKFEDIVTNMGYVKNPENDSRMYIIEQDSPFYVMLCDTESNNNIYISNDFDKAEQSCK
jgi:hypothetical protein